MARSSPEAVRGVRRAAGSTSVQRREAPGEALCPGLRSPPQSLEGSSSSLAPTAGAPRTQALLSPPGRCAECMCLDPPGSRTIPDPSLSPWRTSRLPSASAAVGVHASRLGYNPAQLCLLGFQPSGVPCPLLPTSEAGWDGGVHSFFDPSTSGWRPGASHLHALSPDCLGDKREGTPSLPSHL